MKSALFYDTLRTCCNSKLNPCMVTSTFKAKQPRIFAKGVIIFSLIFNFNMLNPKMSFFNHNYVSLYTTVSCPKLMILHNDATGLKYTIFYELISFQTISTVMIIILQQIHLSFGRLESPFTSPSPYQSKCNIRFF